MVGMSSSDWWFMSTGRGPTPAGTLPFRRKLAPPAWRMASTHPPMRIMKDHMRASRFPGNSRVAGHRNRRWYIPPPTPKTRSMAVNDAALRAALRMPAAMGWTGWRPRAGLRRGNGSGRSTPRHDLALGAALQHADGLGHRDHLAVVPGQAPDDPPGHRAHPPRGRVVDHH